MSKYHAVSSGMVTRQALPSITRQRGTTTGSANLMLYGAGKTTVSNNTTFIDSSTNNFTVTRNGDTVQSGFNPFSQASSGAGYFDGTGDYLTVPSNAAFNFGSGDWTVECWVNLPLTSTMRLMGQTDASSLSTNTSILLDVSTSGVITAYVGLPGGGSFASAVGPSSILANTWAHIVATRNGNNFYVYVNGVGGAATNITGVSLFSSSEPWTVGRNGTFNGFYVTGYISNVRVVKGTAVYTANFTPPTSPLTAITNTSLLLLTDNYSIVNSTATSLPISIFGGATISTTQSPTGMTSSMYFNSATSSYVQTPTNTAVNLSSGNYTVEGWYYLDMATYSSFDLGGRGIVSDYLTNSNGRWLISIGGTGKLEFTEQDAVGQNSATITDPSNSPLQQWVYFAAVKSGTTMYLFKNGTSVGSATSAVRTGFPGRLNVGQSTVDTNYRAFFLGYISNIRVSKGTAIYTSNFTTPSAPLSLSVSVPNFVTNAIYGVNQIP
jgi:hypothetical protein